ncbi:hypothetical protein [Desulfosarcina cetonica]|uniref:hypothetical protein n=1 Tax=Desulfosarcina cetonica TaxID=90730 RepID=UPI0006D0C58E|nr:hypothetical protein [Desulfosarcina cetonica]
MKCLTIIIVVLMGCLLAGLPHPVMAGMAEKIEADSREAVEGIKEAVVETREPPSKPGGSSRTVRSTPAKPSRRAPRPLAGKSATP